jgi:hypothetical protein
VENEEPRSLFSSICGIAFTLKRLALDSAKCCFDMMCAVFILAMLRRDVPNSHYKVNSAKQQTVTFMDAEDTIVDSRYAGTMDSTRSDSMIQDVPLGDFFSRPVMIYTDDWTPGMEFTADINPWNDFFTDDRVAARLANYRLLQAKLHVKFLINGNAFFYGRLLASYQPLYDADNFGKTTAGGQPDIVLQSQRPHVFLDPTTSTGGQLDLPFYWYKNAIDIVSGSDLLSIGQIKIRTLNILKHANGATDKISISVFAWASDVKLSVPTEAVNPFLTARAAENALQRPNGASDEYGTGPISRPASALAVIAQSLAKVPWLQPYATATTLAASAVSGMASVFGYSRPAILETKVFKRVSKGNFANSNVDDDVNRLTLDCKQELSIDSRIDGMAGQDELELKHIWSRESYLTSFNWPRVASQGNLLWNMVLDPSAMFQTSGSGDNSQHYLTAMAFACAPFTFWRGSFKVRFQVVASKYHRGRLRIVYDPFETSLLPNYNTAYTALLDITEETDFTMNVGWGQSTTWRRLGNYATGSLNYSTTPMGYDSINSLVGNGTLAIYVVNELAVPDSTIDNDISINVYVSAGDDFEVAVPNGDVIHRFRFDIPQNVSPYPVAIAEEIDPLEDDFDDRFDQLPNGATEDGGVQAGLDELDPSPVTTIAGTTSPEDCMKLVHFGETYKSFRPLLKRYMLHEISSLPAATPGSAATNTWHTRYRTAMPFECGACNVFGDLITAVPQEHVGAPYNVWYAMARTTLLRYVSSAYVGWKGSIRYAVDTGGMSRGGSAVSTNENLNKLSAHNRPFTGVYNTILDMDEAYPTPETVYTNSRTLNGLNGFFQQPTEDNKILSFEVPFYSQNRFCLSRTKTLFSNVTGTTGLAITGSPSYVLTIAPRSNSNSGYYESYAAAGEDFTCSFFIGAPPLHLDE